jgi:hypothetical protein
MICMDLVGHALGIDGVPDSIREMAAPLGELAAEIRDFSAGLLSACGPDGRLPESRRGDLAELVARVESFLA